MPTHQAPIQTRQADMPLASLQMAVRGVTRAADGDASAQTPAARFELVFTTGAPVKRYDYINGRYYMERLEVTPEAINLDRLERGAPLLNTHWSWDLESQIGVVEQPSIENGIGTCQSQLSRRDSVRGIVQDLEDRVIRNVSVGYAREAIEMIAPSEENGMWEYRVTRWTPLEVSLVPIPADMDSQVRSIDGKLQDPQGRELRAFPCAITVRGEPATTTEQPAAASAAPAPTSAAEEKAETRQQPGETTMTQAATQQNHGTGNPAAATTEAVEAARQAAVQEGQRVERERQAAIRSAIEPHRTALGADASALETRCINEGLSIEATRAQVLDALATASESTVTRGLGNVRTVRDETDTLRTRMSDALTLRANPSRTELAGKKLDLEGARAFRGMDLIDMARRSIAAVGGNADGLSRREIAIAALNLDSSIQRSAGMHGLSDFPEILANTAARSLRAAYQLAPRTFTGWARRSTNKDFREKAVTQLSELSAMKKVVEGAEYKYASLSDGAEKYALSKYGSIIAITWESLVNDDMSAFDRLPLMIAEEAAAIEGDIVYGILTANAALADGVALFHADHANLTSTGTAISDTSLGVARALMRKQTGPQGRVLNLAPSFLIVSPDKEVEANKYTSASFVAAKASDINPNFNTSLQVVVDARLTGNAWYMSADPARIDTVEYAYLEGEEGLFTERKMGFEVDGLLIKARHVFAAKAIDSRGLYKNAGA
jgi:hypothetical protein